MSKVTQKAEGIIQEKRVRIRKLPKGAEKEDFDQAQDLTMEAKAEGKPVKAPREKPPPIPNIQVKAAATTKEKRKQTIKQDKEVDPPPDISQTPEFQEYLSTYLRNEEKAIENLVMAKPVVVQYLNYHHKLKEIKELSQQNNAAQDADTQEELRAQLTFVKIQQKIEHKKYIVMYEKWQLEKEKTKAEDARLLEDFEKAERAFNEKNDLAFPQETIPKQDLTNAQRDSLLWLLDSTKETVILSKKEESQYLEDMNMTEDQAYAIEFADHPQEYQQLSNQQWEFKKTHYKIQDLKNSWDTRNDYQASLKKLPPDTKEKKQDTPNQYNDDINKIIEEMVKNYDLYANGTGDGLLRQLRKLKSKKEFQGDKKATKILQDSIKIERWRLQEEEEHEFSSDSESDPSSNSSSVSAITTNTNELYIIFKTQHTTCICIIIYYQIVFNITNIEQYLIYIHGITTMHNYKLNNCLNSSVLSLS
jgi:hypothetical protein